LCHSIGFFGTGSCTNTGLLCFRITPADGKIRQETVKLGRSKTKGGVADGPTNPERDMLGYYLCLFIVLFSPIVGFAFNSRAGGSTLGILFPSGGNGKGFCAQTENGKIKKLNPLPH
jgi:hypothetical protein